jgi:hypothetical protein
MRLNLQQFKRGVNLLDLGKLPPMARKSINWGGEIVIPAARGTRVSKISANGIPSEWIKITNTPKTHQVILFLHGGGYCLCGPSTHRAWSRASPAPPACPPCSPITASRPNTPSPPRSMIASQLSTGFYPRVIILRMSWSRVIPLEER